MQRQLRREWQAAGGGGAFVDQEIVPLNRGEPAESRAELLREV